MRITDQRRAYSVRAVGPLLRLVTTVLLWVVAFGVGTPALASIGIVESLSTTVSVGAGDTVARELTVFNNGDTVRRVNVSVQDIMPTSSVESMPEGDRPPSAEPWIDLETDSFLISPGENRTFTFRVVLSEAETTPQSRWTSIVFEPAQSLQPTEQQDGIQIRTLTRYAYTVIVHANDPVPSPINIGDVTSITEDVPTDVLRLAADLSVDSKIQRALTQVQVFNRTTGEQISATTPVTVRIYPGLIRRTTYEIERPMPGQYEVLLIVDAQDGDVSAVRLDLDIGSPSLVD